MTTTTTIAVPTSCAALCTKLAEVTQRIENEIAEAGSGAASDYGGLEQRIADALGEVERGLHAQILARLDIDVPAIRVWGDEVMQLRALQLSDRWVPAVQRATRPLAKSVQIVGGLGARPAANANRSTALDACGRGVRGAA